MVASRRTILDEPVRAEKRRCETWARKLYPTKVSYPVYYMTDTNCMKQLSWDAEEQPPKKRPREDVEYEWIKKTRRVDGPNAELMLEEGEWEMAEVWVKRAKKAW